MPVIRVALPTDVNGIASVHVASWRSTYPGMIPASILSGLSIDRRRQQWEAFFEQNDTSRCLFVAEEDGRITGFAAGGPQRDEDFPAYDGELYAIYLLADTQRQGIGRHLTQAVANHLLHHGFESMLTWVIRGNPARHFYERMGGTQIGEKPLQMGGETVVELAYGWPQIAVITADR